jgi:hypothetical protein
MEDVETQEMGAAQAVEPSTAAEDYGDEATQALVRKLAKRITADKLFHKDAFKRMREDMLIARTGAKANYPEANYKANFTGQHIRQKTAGLYAKNPKIRARRRETLDFAIWDETNESLQMAMQALAMAQQIATQAAQTAPAQVDPMTGEAVPMIPSPGPQAMQAFEAAQALVADYQQGMARRMQLDRIGKTLEIVFSQAMREQKPLDFKRGMKKLVRRACTTAVGYAKLDFQREMGPPPATLNGLEDMRTRLAHLERLVAEASEGEIEEDDAEIAELREQITAMEASPEVIIREGLIIDFPASTRVVPDKLTRSLVGFVGARHITVEYFYTPDQVREIFGVDLKGKYKGYSLDEKGEEISANVVPPDTDLEEDMANPTATGEARGLVLVWEHFDKASGLVYYLADGCKQFLKPPGPPNVLVEDFWPVYAITFNDVEDESCLFPPSDVRLLWSQQNAYNDSRQGMMEHRYAARPRWIGARGALDEEAQDVLAKIAPMQTGLINLPAGSKIGDVLQALPVPGVDPNLYETGQIFTDTQLVAGTSAANLGGISKATATESAIAANAASSADGSAVDDLDDFLTVIARAAGQILLREMTEDTVRRIAGVGAMWPPQSDLDILEEVFLEVEAGSTGKPNQAVEVQNFKELGPLLMQIPGVKPERLAKEGIKRLDDRLEVTEFIENGLPAIVAQNRMMGGAGPAAPGAGAPQGDPNADPNAQGAQGGDNGPQPPRGSGGSDAAFGSNQV